MSTPRLVEDYFFRDEVHRSALQNSSAITWKFSVSWTTWKFISHAWIRKNLQQKPLQAAWGPLHSSCVSPKISIRQVYLSGFFVLRKCGTLLSTATYWKPLHPSILPMSYVLRNTIRPSLGYSVALQTILIVTALSTFIHESG